MAPERVVKVASSVVIAASSHAVTMGLQAAFDDLLNLGLEVREHDGQFELRFREEPAPSIWHNDVTGPYVADDPVGIHAETAAGASLWPLRTNGPDWSDASV
jgi:hypothetical protein